MSKQKPTHTGNVIERLPNLEYRVEVTDGGMVRCYLAGLMRKFHVLVVEGDTVDIVWSGRAGEVGRITRRK